MSTCPSVVLTVNHAYHRKRVIHEANTLPHLRVTGLLDILFLLQMLPKLFSLLTPFLSKTRTAAIIYVIRMLST